MATVRANYQRRPEEPSFVQLNPSSSSSFGCLNDDDDECVMMTSPSSRDKRLGSEATKSVRYSSPRPTFLAANPTSKSYSHLCRHDDDDDCASGDEELTSDGEGQLPVKIHVDQRATNLSTIQLGPSNSSSTSSSMQRVTSTFRRGSSAQPSQGRTRLTPQTRTPSADSLRTSRATPSAANNQSKPLLGSNSRQTGRSSSFGRNVALISGIASGIVVLVLVLCYVFYRYRGHEEGSYKLDTLDSYDPGSTKPGLCPMGGTSSSSGARTARQIREWYV